MRMLHTTDFSTIALVTATHDKALELLHNPDDPSGI